MESECRMEEHRDSNESGDPDRNIHCDDFREQSTVNIEDSKELFHAIYKKVVHTPHSGSLLRILKMLFQIDPCHSNSQMLWTKIEKLTQEAIQDSSKSLPTETILRPTREPSTIPLPAPPLPHPPTGDPSTIPPQAPPLPQNTIGNPSTIPPTAPHLPQPPTADPSTIPPKAPPLPQKTIGNPTIPIGQPMTGGPINVQPVQPSPTCQSSSSSTLELLSLQPENYSPDPRCKMKTLNWTTLSPTSFNKDTLWAIYPATNDKITVNYSKLEELFAEKLEPTKTDTQNAQKDSKSGEIPKFNRQKSMNVDIFLKKIGQPPEKVIELIEKGDPLCFENDLIFGVDKLERLYKILPSKDEEKALKPVLKEDMEKLDKAEKFCVKLMRLPGYEVRIEAMILKEEFASLLEPIRLKIVELAEGCKKLHANDSIRTFLLFVLDTGNFINKNKNNGNAFGFRYTSLQKLLDTKSNIDGVTLLHHLVEEAGKQNKASLQFVEDLLDPLQRASRFQLSETTTEFNQIKRRVEEIRNKLTMIEDEYVMSQFSEFIYNAMYALKAVEGEIEQANKWSVKLAHYYCEKEGAFKLDDFLRTFKQFCENIKSCQQDLKKAQYGTTDTRRNVDLLGELKRRQSGQFNKRQRNNSVSW